MQSALPSHLVVYTGLSLSYAKPLYFIESRHSKEGNLRLILQAARDAPTFWIAFITTSIITLVVGLWLLWRFRDNSVYRAVEGETIQWPSKAEMKAPGFIAFHVVAFIYVGILITFMLLRSPRPLSWFAWRPHSFNALISLTHWETRLPRAQRRTLFKNVHSFLPPGRYWLDGRRHVEYPAVHGDVRAYCAYNADLCSKFVATPSPTPLPHMPNVLLLIYESMNPLTYLMDCEFIDEHSGIAASDPRYLVTDTPFFNRDLMPYLREFAKTGITFSGMSSHGLPTVSGWHALMTGAVPAQSYLNIQYGRDAHSDDLPSFMRGEGYRSFFVTNQNAYVEGFQHFLYRRSAMEEALVRLRCPEGLGDLLGDPVQMALAGMPFLTNCDAARVNATARRLQDLDRPKWFDYIASYFPDEHQAALLNLSWPSLVYHDWYADRIAGQQFQLHWRQQRALLNRTKTTDSPIFGIFLDVESHMPYLGYDRSEFYGGMGDDTKEQRFKRVNRYVDRYAVENTIEFLKREDPNTIVIITGDHGTRDIPVRTKQSPVTNETIFAGDCVGTSSGVDALFVVSAVVSYLGDDPEVKSALGLDRLAGKTVKVATDHNDLTYTLMEVVGRLKGHSLPPTHKRSRNLVDLATTLFEHTKTRGTDAAIAALNASGWQSLSVVTYQMDYRNGSQLLRTHTSDSSQAHYYSNVSYPTCLKRLNTTDMRLGGEHVKEMTNAAFQYLAHENYLLRTNSLYNYGFRDTECIRNGSCKFPTRKPYRIIEGYYAKFSLAFPLTGGVLGFLIVGVMYLKDWIGRGRKARVTVEIAGDDSKLFTEP